MLNDREFFENIGIKSAVPERMLKGSLYEEPGDFIVNEVHKNFTCSIEPGRTRADTDINSPYIHATLVKRNISTFEACSQFCMKNGLDYLNDINFCGLKDTLGVTSQLVCIRNSEHLKIKNSAFDDFFLKDFTGSDTKMEVGSHVGNRFIIRARGIEENGVCEVASNFKSFVERGFPNFYGPQRFGVRQNNHFMGKHLLKEEYEKFLFEFLTFSRNECKEVSDVRKLIKDDFGSWDRCLKSLNAANGLQDEKYIISSLVDGKSLFESIKGMKLSNFFVHSYGSYLFNMALSDFLKKDWYDAELEKIGKGSVLDGLSSDLYAEIMEKEGICIRDFDACKFKIEPHKRNTLFRVKDFSFNRENGDAIVEFALGKGEYASLVLCFLIDSDIRKLC